MFVVISYQEVPAAFRNGASEATTVRRSIELLTRTIREWNTLTMDKTSATHDVNELNTLDNLLKTAVDTELNFSYNTDIMS